MPTVKYKDFPFKVAASIFELLNEGKVEFCPEYTKRNPYPMFDLILTDTEPKDLNYPEGFYYDHGDFTNKGNTEGEYSYGSIMMMRKEDRELWKHFADYSTLNDETHNSN